MRTHLIPATLAAAAAFVAAPPAARADTVTYDIAFTADIHNSGYPTPPGLPTGSFGYDADTHLFSGFLVSVDGHTFDLTASANAPETYYTPNGFLPGGLTGGAYSFAYLTSGLAEWAYEAVDQNVLNTESFDGTFQFGGPALPVSGFAEVLSDRVTASSPYDLQSRGPLYVSADVQGHFTLSAAPSAAAPLPSTAAGGATLSLALLAGRIARRRRPA